MISGGGTGGHIYPAIAIADEIKKRDPEAEIIFIGSENGLECQLVPAAGYSLESITVTYLKRKLSLHNLKSAKMLLKGLFQVKRLIDRFRPDFVIGTGGYVSGPVVYVAAKKGIYTLIHEQNAYPGLTNRFLSKHVSVVALSFQEAAQHFKKKDNLTLTGNPIRSAYYTLTKEKTRINFPEFNNRKMVLISGGSGGSSNINKTVQSVLEKYPNSEYSLFWSTGKIHYERTISNLKEKGIDLAGHRVVPYIDEMPEALLACDLVVGSAGAISIAEIQAAQRYSILIPKAYTADNHQEKNARMLEKTGRATVILEKELTSERLHQAITQGLKVKKPEKKEMPVKLSAEMIVEKLEVK